MNTNSCSKISSFIYGRSHKVLILHVESLSSFWSIFHRKTNARVNFPCFTHSVVSQLSFSNILNAKIHEKLIKFTEKLTSCCLPAPRKIQKGGIAMLPEIPGAIYTEGFFIAVKFGSEFVNKVCFSFKFHVNWLKFLLMVTIEVSKVAISMNLKWNWLNFRFEFRHIRRFNFLQRFVITRDVNPKFMLTVAKVINCIGLVTKP